MSSITLSRLLLPGALALGALGAIGGFAPGVATAEAAPSVSPFAGSYIWGGGPVTITISDGGRIKASYADLTIDGRVRADGSYSFTELMAGSSGDDDPVRYRSRTKYAGTMALDVDHNIVVTDDTQGSFVWFRL